MAVTIDELQLKLSSDMGTAGSNIDALVTSLSNLKGTLAQNVQGFDTASTSLKNLTTNFNNLKQAVSTKIDFSGFNGLSRRLNSLTGRIDASALSAKLNAIEGTLQRFRAGLSGSAPPVYVLESLTRSIRVFNRLGRMDTAGITRSIDAVVASLPKLSQAMQSLSLTDNQPGIKSVSSLANAIIKLEKLDASKAISNVKSVADAIPEAIAKLNRSETVRTDIGNFMKNIRQLSSGTGSLNVNMKNMANHTLPRFGNAMKKSGGNARSLLYTFYKIRGVVWAIRRLLGYFGNSITYASDIVEVANVVRNTFRDAEGQIAEFVDGSHEMLKQIWSDQGWDTENIPGITERIGMNELAVSKMASRFQAMGKAMGFPNEQMATMSLRLTQLAGDMASFYNVDVSDVSDDLNAIFTGQTRPMRQYGIDLTMATLSQYALSKGITDSVQTMTQAEKTMLRYEYVLEHLQMVNGDFAATASTWANQIRILKMNLQELGGVWGGIFVNAFKPFVQGLNRVLTSVINFSKKIADALGFIFGWTIEITDRGMLDPLADMEDYADGAEDLSDGLGGAAGSAKDLKKALSVLSFDELNQLNGDSNSGGSGGSGGSGAAAAAAAAASGLDVTVKRVDTLMEKYKSDIQGLYGLGSYISNALTTAMGNIDWQAAYQKAASFGTGLALFLNGLITPELFEGFGTTVAGAVNTAISAAFSFGKVFRWKQQGEAIARGLVAFFSTVRFDLAGETVNTWVNGILDSMITALDTFADEGGSDKMAEAIVKFFDKIEFDKILTKLVEVFGKLAVVIVEALGKAIVELAGENPLAAAIVALVGGNKLIGAAGALLGGVGGAAGTAAGGGLLAGAGGAVSFGAQLLGIPLLIQELFKGAWERYDLSGKLFENVFNPDKNIAVKQGIDFLDMILPKGLKDKYDITTGTGRDVTIEDLNKAIKEKGSTPFWELIGSSEKQHEKRVVKVNELVKAIDKAISSEKNLEKATESTSNTLSNSAKQYTSYYATKFAELKENGKHVTREIVRDAENMMITIWDNVEIMTSAYDPVADGWENSMKHAFVGGGGGGGMTNTIALYAPAVLTDVGGVATHLIEKMQPIVPGFEKVGKDAMGGLETGYNAGKTSFFANNVAKLGSELSTSAGDVSKALEPKGIEAVAGMISGWNIKLPSLKTLASTLKGTLKDSIGDTSSIMKPIGSDVVSKITSGLTEGISGVKNTLSSFGQAILNNLPGGSEMYSTGKSIFQRFAEGISSVYIKTPHFTQSTSIWDTIKDKLGNVVASLPKISVSWWAKGGYFNGPNVIGVGEAGPEAVLPLSNGRAMSAIADSINKAGAGLDRTELTQAVAEGYVRAMMMNPTPPINVNAVLYTEDNEVLARAVNRGNQSIGYRQNPTAAY